jgi:hypothetical protein
LVANNHFSNYEQTVIIEGLKQLLGSNVRIELVKLDSVPSGKKWRFTESHLNVKLDFFP